MPATTLGALKEPVSVQTYPEVIFDSLDPNIEGLRGPFELTSGAVDSVINSQQFGCFAAGTKIGDTSIQVGVIGRSECGLAVEILNHSTSHSHFMVLTTPDPESAFDLECRLYHKFGRNLQIRHPLRPFEKGWPCPKCGIFNPGV